jgi:putative FmdB family regulatory protein
MPIYEYECTKCGHQLEAFQKMSDAALQDCPACHTPTVLQKLISAAGFQLKGTGWYATDFRTPKPGEKAPPNTTASASSNEAKPIAPLKKEADK